MRRQLPSPVTQAHAMAAPVPQPAAAQRVATGGRVAGRRWLLVIAALCAAAGAWPARAVVQAYPPAAQPPIDSTTLAIPSPQLTPPDNAEKEKQVESLRRAAQVNAPTPPRSPRAPGRAGSSPALTPAPAEAAWLLGLLALHGLAMPADPLQAQHWFERAQMLGHPLAPAGLAWCQLIGCVTAPSPAAALQWVTQLRRADAGLAGYLEWYATQSMAPLALPGATAGAADQGRAAPPASRTGAASQRLLLQASRAGNAQAQNELGLVYVTAGDYDKALAQFQAAAPRSAAAAGNASQLAERLRGSIAAERTRAARPTGADWYVQARRYHTGDGVPANYAEAVRLYQIAASAGDTRARRMLGLIFSRPAPDGTVDVAWMRQLAAMEPGTTGRPTDIAVLPAAPGWQRDPSPLYDWVPPEWRAVGSEPRR